MDNAEINNITKILGIEPKKDYKSARQLRYGKLMVMADQDYDGSHIKGLIINLVQHWWPSLFQLPGFLQEFVPPIVKATRKNTVHQFFTLSASRISPRVCHSHRKGDAEKYRSSVLHSFSFQDFSKSLSLPS